MSDRPMTRQELDERYRRGEISEKDYGRALLEFAGSGVDVSPPPPPADVPLPSVNRSFAPAIAGAIAVLAATVAIVFALRHAPAPAPVPTPPPAAAPAAAPAADNAAAPGADHAASGDAAASGSFGREAVGAVVRAHNDEVRACIDQESGLHGGMKGRIDTMFVVAPDGKVLSCEATTDGGVPAAAKCICERLRTWRFPARKGGNVVTVRYPFVFAME